MSAMWRTVKAVAWSFFGVRKGSDYQKDVADLKPLHLIVVGLISVFIFVMGLIVFVHWVVSK